VLEAAADALRAAGSEVRIEGETVHAEADTQAWDAALQTALRHAQHLLGPMAARRFEAVREAYA